ncbi:MAG: glycerophosphodiester phosphodiesterase family protein [Pseudobdellovibrionaceae bacterium]
MQKNAQKIKSQLFFLFSKIFLTIFLMGGLFGCQSSSSLEAPVSVKKRPLIIGHRGAPGTYPDHTLESYREAIRQGADVVEPDLVITKDGVLICRHENDLSQTTNVSKVFPQRKKTKTIDGRKITGWFSEDFTLKEIKQLRVRQPLAFRPQQYNDLFLIPTFDELLSMIIDETSISNRTIGIYPETKHPSYFQGIKLPLEEALLLALKKRGFPKNQSPVFIQSFEISNLKQIKSSQNYSSEYKLVQLFGEGRIRPYDQVLLKLPTTYENMMTNEGLEQIKTYADGIGPWKRLIREESLDKSLLPPNNLVSRAQGFGLFVHVYTFRDEKSYLSTTYQEKPENEYFDYFDLGVDGVYSDFPATAKRARDIWMGQEE